MNLCPPLLDGARKKIPLVISNLSSIAGLSEDITVRAAYAGCVDPVLATFLSLARRALMSLSTSEIPKGSLFLSPSISVKKMLKFILEKA